jgi:hypothetical protein
MVPLDLHCPVLHRPSRAAAALEFTGELRQGLRSEGKTRDYSHRLSSPPLGLTPNAHDSVSRRARRRLGARAGGKGLAALGAQAPLFGRIDGSAVVSHFGTLFRFESKRDGWPAQAQPDKSEPHRRFGRTFRGLAADLRRPLAAQESRTGDNGSRPSTAHSEPLPTSRSASRESARRSKELCSKRRNRSGTPF